MFWWPGPPQTGLKRLRKSKKRQPPPDLPHQAGGRALRLPRGRPLPIRFCEGEGRDCKGEGLPNTRLEGRGRCQYVFVRRKGSPLATSPPLWKCIGAPLPLTKAYWQGASPYGRAIANPSLLQKRIGNGNLHTKPLLQGARCRLTVQKHQASDRQP